MNQNVLFEDNDWRGEAFHLPINVDASIFDGLDDTTSSIIPTATILGETALAITAPIAVDKTNADTAMEEAVMPIMVTWTNCNMVWKRFIVNQLLTMIISQEEKISLKGTLMIEIRRRTTWLL